MTTLRSDDLYMDPVWSAFRILHPEANSFKLWCMVQAEGLQFPVSIFEVYCLTREVL
jgi:hypothetical protein